MSVCVCPFVCTVSLLTDTRVKQDVWGQLTILSLVDTRNLCQTIKSVIPDVGVANGQWKAIPEYWEWSLSIMIAVSLTLLPSQIILIWVKSLQKPLKIFVLVKPRGLDLKPVVLDRFHHFPHWVSVTTLRYFPLFCKSYKNLFQALYSY